MQHGMEPSTDRSMRSLNNWCRIWYMQHGMETSTDRSMRSLNNEFPIWCMQYPSQTSTDRFMRSLNNGCRIWCMQHGMETSTDRSMLSLKNGCLIWCMQHGMETSTDRSMRSLNKCQLSTHDNWGYSTNRKRGDPTGIIGSRYKGKVAACHGTLSLLLRLWLRSFCLDLHFVTFRFLVSVSVLQLFYS